MAFGRLLIVFAIVAAGACGGESQHDADTDAGADAAPDVGADGAPDVGADGAPDVGVDADRDTGDDASPEASTDAGGDVVDAGCRDDQVQVGSECLCPASHHERMGVCVPDVERHPGHWVLLSDLESIRVPADAAPADREDLTALDEIASSSSNVTGVLVRFFWRDLNGADGVFQLGRIEEQLDRLAAIAAEGGPSLQYAPLIAWRSYAPADHPMPDYLSSFEEPAGEGHRGQVWKPAVRARYRELLEAIEAAVGDHAHFGGVGTQETAVGPEPRDGYSPVLYAEALTDIGLMHREIFPSKEIFFIFNFLSATPAACADLDRETDCGSWPSDRSECGPCLLGHVLSTLASHDVALGGPDILPDNASLVSQVYPHYPALAAEGARLFCHAQKDSFRVTDGDGFLPMQEIFDFARDDLHVDYVFWFHKETGTGQSYDAAVPVIDGNPLPWL